MTDVFAYVNAINFNKKDLMVGSENDTLAESSYVPYITNRSLSYFPDTIMYANDMNMYSALDNKLQFHYLLHSIRPKKRFSKWAKRQPDSDVDNVMEVLGYNRKRAEEAVALLSVEQLNDVRKYLEKGGMGRKSTSNK